MGGASAATCSSGLILLSESRGRQIMNIRNVLWNKDHIVTVTESQQTNLTIRKEKMFYLLNGERATARLKMANINETGVSNRATQIVIDWELKGR